MEVAGRDRINPDAEAGNPGSTARLARSLEIFISKESGVPSSVSIDKRYVNGFSWQTYGITVSQLAGASGGHPVRKLILRLGHDRGLLSPYRAEPEAVVLQAVGAAGFPVPPVHWYSDDASILGAPFLVVGFADGEETSAFGKKDAAQISRDLAIGEQFADWLAQLHRFDWTATDIGKVLPVCDTGNAAIAQVNTWKAMIGESGMRPLPLLHYALLWLERNPPVAPRVCLVHGDYRAGNFLQRDGRMTAILDWELMHLGDPHADIAWASMRFLSGGGDLVSGLIPRDVFIRRYEEKSGITIDPASLLYHEVLALVKICAMNMRAAGRIERGEAPDARMTALGFGLPQLQSEIARVLRKART